MCNFLTIFDLQLLLMSLFVVCNASFFVGETSSVTSQQMPVLPENLYPKQKRDSRIPVAMKLILTTCSKCHNCGGILYDEEIMAGWSPEDSNLNTKYGPHEILCYDVVYTVCCDF